jgi:hypothetical protein
MQHLERSLDRRQVEGKMRALFDHAEKDDLAAGEVALGGEASPKGRRPKRAQVGIDPAAIRWTSA